MPGGTEVPECSTNRACQAQYEPSPPAPALKIGGQEARMHFCST